MSGQLTAKLLRSTGAHVNPALVQGPSKCLTGGGLAQGSTAHAPLPRITAQEVSSGHTSDGLRGSWTAPVVKGQTERRARHP